MIAKTEQIEFQTFALYHPPVRQIADAYLRKIRLARYRAETGELRTVEAHPVVIAGMLVFKSFQHLGSIIVTVFCLAAQCFQIIVLSHKNILLLIT